MSFEIAYVDILNKHGERILAAFYVVHKILSEELAEELERKDANDLYKCLKNKMSMTSQKFRHLSEERIQFFGEKLRYVVNVLRHYMFFQQGSLKLLQQAAESSKSFGFSWNYVHIQNIMKLYTYYVKTFLFLNSIQKYEKAISIYSYCYQKKTGHPFEELDKFYFLFFNRSTPLALISDLKMLNPHIFTMFKSVSAVLERILGPSTSFDWSLLNISDNPKNSQPGSNFFKMEYILMMDLSNIIDWFLSFSIVEIEFLTTDTQILEVFKLIAHQKFLFVLHGDYCIELKTIFESVKKSVKLSQELDFSNLFNINLFDKNRKVRDFRRNRLAMALDEAYNAVSSDPNIYSLKIAVILSLLGYANFEISTSLSFFKYYKPKQYNNSFLALFVSVYRLATFGFKHQDLIKRFIFFNLREYDSYYLENLMRTFHIPQENYNMLSLFITSLRTLDIQEFDKGKQYDLEGLRMNIERLMSSFNKYSVTNGILHLSPLFDLISLLYFHVNLFISPTDTILRSIPLHTYWSYNQVFIEYAHNFQSEDSYAISCFLAFAHYYSIDINTYSEWNEFPNIIQKFVEEILKLIWKSITIWSESFHNGILKELRLQEKISTVEKVTQMLEKQNKPNYKTQQQNESKVLSTLISIESMLENRDLLEPAAKYIGLLCNSMKLINEIGKITIFDNTYNLNEIFIEKSKTLIPFLFDKFKVIHPDKLVESIQSSKYILNLILMSANINPQEIIQKNISDLTYVELVINEKVVDIKHDDDQIGFLTQSYVQYYKEFLREKIHKLVYSSTRQCFISNDNVATLSALRSLYSVIGINGMVYLDIVASEATKEFMDKLNLIISYEIPSEPSKATFVNNPSALTHAETVIGYFNHIGCILQFRKLIREAINLDPVVYPKYAFMAKDINPDKDIVLQSRIARHSIVKSFSEICFAMYFGALFSTAYWSKVSYIPNEDSLSDNSHLIALTMDAIVGCATNMTKSVPYIRIYNQMLENMQIGIKAGNVFHQKNKKVNYPFLTMYIVLDNFVKNSFYADYAMLETVASYNYIRTIYSLMLRKNNNSNQNTKQAVKQSK
ncbi:nck-associated protein 1-like [Histomonas meleagridis]|uniref:nck-associated protein 1-like n=1 Tax=Histomonas meleagridis TaxID=135588 RepID=UPI00355A2035|nr:nck-associated protein 1-like [Histomonas meleagridis]KAH0799562.1 nck-associated protein 1-like [Histomonas meleagridis]